MAILSELSAAVKQRRTDIGLSQERLAKLAGLSRATVNELETGRMLNLSLLRTEKLVNALGLGLAVTGLVRKQEWVDAIAAAARVASVSYGKDLPSAVLEEALLLGVLPPGFMPQMRAVLEEAPIALLAGVAAELDDKHGAPLKVTWQNMRNLASVLKCERGIWN